MSLIDRLIDDARLKLKTRPSRVTDKLLGILHALSLFADRVQSPRSAEIPVYKDSELPASAIYNDTLQRIMDDLHLIREHQRTMLSGLLISWNESEQILESEVQAAGRSLLPIDKNFPVTTIPAKTNGDITLAIRAFNSGIPILKAAPSLKASCTDASIKPLYGKAYGLYIPGNESGEDGIRTNKNDGGAIIDNRDTFWEAEAVTLQEEMADDVFTPQIINTNEVSLIVNITLSFRNPVNLNSFTIVPHSFAQSAYYDIVAIDVISGARTVPILTEARNCFSTTRITFTTLEANGLNITLRQDKGYFQKYTLARYTLQNNAAWIDFTGPHLIERVERSQGELNAAIRNEIESAGEWVSGIWVPNAPTQEVAELDVLSGEDGYMRVESVASRRKRWAIGIQEIQFGEETYESVSEVVTQPYDMPDETTSVYLVVDDDTPDGTKVSYALSFDDGSSWNAINPINKTPEKLKTGYIVPQRIFINSDISSIRKENSNAGPSAYVNTANRKVRARALLEKDDTTTDTPRIRDFYPVFHTGVPPT